MSSSATKQSDVTRERDSGILKLFAQFHNVGKVAEVAGLTPRAVSKTVRERLGPLRQLGIMCEIYASGATLEQVGKAFGVSEFTVRNRFKQAGLKVRSRTENAELELEQAHMMRATIVRLYRETGDEGTVAQNTGLHRGAIERVLKESVPKPLLRKGKHRTNSESTEHGETRPRYSREECLSALRQAAQVLQRIPTEKEYSAFRVAHSHQLPCTVTIHKRFNGWCRALWLAFGEQLKA